MKLSAKTILITGGSSGIGLEMALQLNQLGNSVIITGRDQKKLVQVAREYPCLHTIQSDVSDPEAIASLYERMLRDFPALDVLINNAGVMRKINLQDSGGDLKDLTREIETNLVGAIRMTAQFLPHLKSRPAAAIVNVSSGLAFTPFPISPVYCATKAGLHSFTQSLRVQLKKTSITVFELAPPATETPLLDDFHASDMKGVPLMSVQKLVQQAIRGIQSDQAEILPGASKLLRWLSRLAPALAVRAASGPVDAMLAQPAS